MSMQLVNCQFCALTVPPTAFTKPTREAKVKAVCVCVLYCWCPVGVQLRKWPHHAAAESLWHTWHRLQLGLSRVLATS